MPLSADDHTGVWQSQEAQTSSMVQVRDSSSDQTLFPGRTGCTECDNEIIEGGDYGSLAWRVFLETADLSGEMAASMLFPPGCAVDSGVAMAAEHWHDACASMRSNLRASFMAASSLLWGRGVQNPAEALCPRVSTVPYPLAHPRTRSSAWALVGQGAARSLRCRD